MEQDMSNENRDKATWKDRLEDPAILGLTSSESNALWEKLDDRLREKPHRKRMIWYWAAAACLLLAILLPFLKNNTVSHANNSSAVVKQQPVSSMPNENIDQTPPAPAENSGLVIEKRQAVKVARQDKIAIASIDNVPPEVVTTSTGTLVQNEIQPIQNSIAPIVVTPVAIAAAAPVLKQKLKVVHINELGYPEEAARRDDHIADYRSIRFNPVSQETYTTTSTSQNISDLNFFKTKTTPSN
jgi:hypothetical protein